MARAFDDKDRTAIRTTLVQVGMAHFERYGIRQTRIEDICRAAGIAKGSFYTFFPSREELFMTIVEEREAAHMRDMLAYVDSAKGNDRQRAMGFFDLILGKIEADPILNIVLAHGEIPHLVLKLGAARFEAGHRKDRAFARTAARHWNRTGGRPVSAADLLGLMTIALSIAMQRRQMTNEQYRPTVALLRQLFVDRLAGARS